MRRFSTSRSVLSSAPSASYCRGLGFASRSPLLSSTTTSTHSNVFGSHVESNARNWETTTLLSKALYSTSAAPASATSTQTQTLPYEAIPEVQFPEIMELGGFTKGLYLLRGLNKRYGDIVRANIGGVNVAWIFNPDDIQNVMQHEGKYPQGAATTVWPFVQAFASRGITMLGLATGETWKRLRTAFQKNIFPPGDADTYMPLVTPVVDEALEVIQKNQDKLDVLLPSMTFEMIAAVLFGQSLGAMKGTAAPEDYEYIRCVFTLFESCEDLLHKDPTKVTPEETKPFFDSFDYLMKRGAYHTKLTLEKHKNGTLNSPVPPYLSKSSEIPDVTVEEITNNVLGLLIAGVDTTANTIQWFLYNLARSPEVQEKLAAEVRSVLKGRSLNKDDLNDLPYLKAALKENFRVSPTIPGTARILTESITLNGKYSCPPGTIFFLSPYGVGMNPNVYENPDAFIPDRWDRKAKSERKETNPWHDSVWVHMPFSRGPRMCMGARLAELEVFAFLTGFIQRFKIEFAPDSPASEPISKLTIRPLPAPKFIITPRQ